MIKHILKIIWHQRRNNGWIFVELLLVFAVLCIMMDSLLVNLYTYYKPLGFDITNVYKVNMSRIRCLRLPMEKIWSVWLTTSVGLRRWMKYVWR